MVLPTKATAINISMISDMIPGQDEEEVSRRHEANLEVDRFNACARRRS